MSTDERERIYEARESVERAAKRARAYLKSSQQDIESGRVKNLYGATHVPPEYWGLLDQALDTALTIVEALPDEFFLAEKVKPMVGLEQWLDDSNWNQSDEPFERAKNVVAMIEQRRSTGAMLLTIQSLEDVTGRTPDEAKSYLAKAAELRKRLGL